MKTKQIKGAVDILRINIEDKEIQPINFLRAENGDHYLIFTDGDYLILPPGNWQFHCRLSEMTEEQAGQLVKVGDEGFECWDYLKNDWGHFGFSPEESFQSLLEANGVKPANLFKKPEKPDYYVGGEYIAGEFVESNTVSFEKELQDWQEAEANVFPPETTLVFVKQ